MESSAKLQRLKLEGFFFRNELVDYTVYSKLASSIKDQKIKRLLSGLATTERGHKEIWNKLIEKDGQAPQRQRPMGLKVVLFLIARRLFGITFMIKLLERNEEAGLSIYMSAVHNRSFYAKNKKYLERIIKDEREHEVKLQNELQLRSKGLGYIESIVFGLNDGLVEVLAAIAGLAAFVHTPLVVVISGIIIAISGTLSMTGGAYLSSKSEKIVGNALKGNKANREPKASAYYTGSYYFIGALVPIMPFALGMSGFIGIALAALLTIIALSIASAIIAVIGGTSIKKRILEMVAISIGAVIVTTVIGVIARSYIGLT
ncbi:MAG: VIT1/CCC1 transporter family protein [Candidatus Micrarchaeia archaeon]